MEKSPTIAHELGAFLRTHRAALHPADVGLSDSFGMRRVPGLRREEVAELAFISTDYYTQLEQGRLRHAPRPTLQAIAQALRLNVEETEYLFKLSQTETIYSSETIPAENEIQAYIRHLLNNLPLSPAIVIDRTMHIVDWNPLAAALYLDFGIIPEHERNLIRLTFLHPHFHALYSDWESSARDGVAFLRMDTALTPHDKRLHDLIVELSMKNHKFKVWWESYDVAYKSFGIKRFRHSLIGEISLNWQILHYPANPDYCVMILTAEPGSLSYAALEKLSLMTTQISANLTA